MILFRRVSLYCYRLGIYLCKYARRYLGKRLTTIGLVLVLIPVVMTAIVAGIGLMRQLMQLTGILRIPRWSCDH